MLVNVYRLCDIITQTLGNVLTLHVHQLISHCSVGRAWTCEWLGGQPIE